VAAFVEKIEALGLDRVEFIKRWSAELGGSVEDLLEAFLNSRESKPQADPRRQPVESGLLLYRR
jgi:hypothetical protein